MADGTAAAVDQATRLGEIKFPEFTTKLVTDVFDSLVAANLRQVQSYSELLTATAKTLSAYINDTKDDIGGDQIMQWLATVSPELFGNDSSELGELEGKAPTADTVTAIDAALDLPAEGGDNPSGLTAGDAIDADAKNALLTAVANRIAADKYSLLQRMMKMGVLRLVVESGVIETRLTFNTYGSSVREANSSKYHRDQFAFNASARTGGFLSNWVNASASTSYSSLNVSTASSSERDVSGSSVQIFGRVQINFKTDYAPLADL